MENGGVLTADYRSAESRGSGKECVAPGGYDTESPARAPCGAMRPGGERMPALAQGQRRDAESSREEQPESGYRLAPARPVRGAGRMLCCTRPQHNVPARLMVSAPTWSNCAS